MNNSLRRSERIVRKSEEQNVNKNKTEEVPKSGKKCETKRRQKAVCDKCGSDGDMKKSFTSSKLKTWFDPMSKTSLKVCNICWKRLNRLKTVIDQQNKVSIEDQKQKYLSNCHSFGLSLIQLLNDSSAERLYCPNLKTSGRACACLQRYVIGNDDNFDSKQTRAQHLLDLLRKAKQLSRQKCYSISNPRSGQKIGLGNGHKKSKEFETFVCNERTRLKTELNFCEKAVQRVLFYSNNFLHKKLRTEPNGRQRVERQKGKAVTGRLIPINQLSDQLCCAKKCVQLSKTYPQLLEEWRQRSVIGQQECRRVLAEMLTPTQAVRSNCFKFISLVTGSSFRTITKVSDYLIVNGGNREPTEHGLKKSWIINDKNRITPSEVIDVTEPVAQTSSAEDLLLRTQTLRQISSGIGLSQTESRINLIVNQTNNEISVINTTKRHGIVVLNQMS